MSARRVVACLVLLAGAFGILLVPTSEPAGAADGGGSAVTVHGTGPFADLAVTVHQTEHLINQVVDVTWTGGEQTAPTAGSFAANYLQIMQCWGDGAEPRRENCQFGGLVGDSRGGNWVAGRQISYGADLVDTRETYLPGPGSAGLAYVPFESVTGTSTTEVHNEFYDAYSTNEIPFGRTHADGTGEEFLEVQTAREAPGLGCGQRLDGGAVRNCWLVVVPRGDTEVDGDRITEDLDSSPLSASNWRYKMAVRLDFDPVGLSCPIGTAERRIVGQESVADAVSRWQPVLCDAANAIFGFSQVPDDLARRQALAADPWLSLLTRPVDPAAVPDKRSLVYAPVAVSGVAIAFNIDAQPVRGAPPELAEKAGTRVPTLRLNARLVAKLLTQSYGVATLEPERLAAANPLNLVRDQEFQDLNPDYTHYDLRRLGRITVPAGLSDAYAELWAWVASDPDAKAFLAGTPDPWGMEVNPAYRDLLLSRSDFPISDLACRAATESFPELCPLDYLAYAQDMHEGGRGAARGQTLARDTFNRDAGGGWRLSPPQLSGNRAVLALVDTATAERYRLPVAALRNTAGAYVLPNAQGLNAGLASTKPTAVDGVVQPDPTSGAPGAYPLTHVTYAVTSPEHLAPDEATAYADLLTFIAGAGQVQGDGVGQLPAGYLPLTDAQRAQTAAAAATVRAAATAAPTASATPSASTSASPSATPSETPAPSADGGDPTAAPTAPVAGGSGVVPPPPLSSGPSPKPAKPSPSTTPAAATYATPSAPAGPQRFALAGVLVVAAVLVAAQPLVGRIGRSG